MTGIRSGMRESLATVGTGEGLFSAVNSQMLLDGEKKAMHISIEQICNTTLNLNCDIVHLCDEI